MDFIIGFILATLIVVILLLVLVIFILWTGIKALAFYATDVIDEPDWFNQDQYKAYHRDEIESMFKS